MYVQCSRQVVYGVMVNFNSMGVTPEWTPGTTPQPNQVENPIYVVTMCGCAILIVANVPDDCKNILMPYVDKYEI